MSNNSNNMNNFIGYNEYYEQLRKKKGRNNTAAAAADNAGGPLSMFWNENDFYVEHVKPHLEYMENNTPTRNTKGVAAVKPHSKQDMFKRLMASTRKNEFKRLADKYKEIDNPPPFIDFFLDERIRSSSAGTYHRYRSARRSHKRTHKKRRTSRR